MSTRAALDLQKAASADIYGKRCGACECDLDWVHFAKDSSSRDGHAALCWDCQAAPRLSTSEHISRLSELNFNAEGTKKQRWPNQEDYRNSNSRLGRPMHYTDFIRVLGQLVPNLYFTDGNLVGNLAVFLTYPGPQTRLDGRDFEYLWAIPKTTMPEYSIYQFNETLDILEKEKIRGWRTPLLRCILRDLITEETANKVFGKAVGEASTVWYRKIHARRNRY